MDNKKTILIIIIAAILAFLTASIIFKTSDKPIKLNNEKPLIETEIPQKEENIHTDINIQTETKEETSKEDITEVKKIPTTSKPAPLPAIKKEDEPTIIPLQVKEETKEDVNNNVSQVEQPYKDGDNVIVIPQEYKFKSPAKYSFK